MGIRLHFDSKDWERIRQDYTAWWAHALDRPLVQITGKQADQACLSEPHKFASNYGLDMPAEEVVAQYTPSLEQTRYYGDAFPRWFVNFGPGIMAGFLGAHVHSVPDTVWFEPARQQTAHELHLTYQADNPWWQHIQAVTRAAATAWEGMVAVSHTDLGGNLDIVASFLTTEGLLLSLYDAPLEVDRLAGEVTQLWLQYYDKLSAIIRPACGGTVPWAPIWSAETSYMLQCDFCYMISPAMFERFVLPDLTACCEHLEHGFYHLDGPGAIPHLDLLLSIPRLRGIQWVPGAGNPSPEEWLDLLKRIIDGGKLCQLVLSAQGALQIVRALGGKGFMFTISDQMSAEEAQDYLRLLAEAEPR